MSKVKGLTCLITGAASGLGKSLTLILSLSLTVFDDLIYLK